jgi:uncharacterized membrane protein
MKKDIANKASELIEEEKNCKQIIYALKSGDSYLVSRIRCGRIELDDEAIRVLLHHYEDRLELIDKQIEDIRTY